MKKGFFDLGLGEDPNQSIAQTKTPANAKKGCKSCGLSRSCNSPRIGVKGKGKAGVLIITEGPSKADDAMGRYLSGESGTMFKAALKDLGLKVFSDCWVVGATQCRGSGPVATDSQIADCRGRLLKTIKELEPKIIIPLGTKAIQGLLGARLAGRLKDTKVTAFYGKQIPDQELKCYVCPTYAPSYIQAKEKDKVLARIWKEDLKKSIALLNDYSFEVEPERKVTTAKTVEDTIAIIEKVKASKVITFDYETTGIKPDRPGHEIVCASVHCNLGTFAFPFFSSSKPFLKAWRSLMGSKNIKKVAHNLGFENTWTKKFTNRFVRNWGWDTCLAHHCIDNTAPTNLKYLVYCHFGVMGYDASIDEYITNARPGQDKKNKNNNFNRINEANFDDLLYYCGLDSYYSHILYKRQRRVLKAHRLEGAQYLLKGAAALSEIRKNGMRIDVAEVEKQKVILSKRMSRLYTQMQETEEYQASPKFGLNLLSNKQLAELLYDVLGYTNSAGNRKVDEPALSSIDSPLCALLLQYKKLKKLRDTYLEGFLREETNGIVKPFFNLHNVKTFRSSSSGPNFQNMPKRDKESMKIIRTCVVPRPGNRIIEYDYKGVEVSVGTCYHKDPSMINYILDESTDMHRDMAMQLFFRTLKDITKAERQTAKNGFVFPEFYGSSWPEVAPGIWEQLSDETKAHLKKNGIKGLGKLERDGWEITKCTGFYKHVKAIEEKFWGERFPGYAEWKQNIYKQYKEDGYIDSLTGFRCWGPLKFTEATNYQIQGSAFHCLMYALIHGYKPIEQISGRSFVIGQIHDALVVDVHPEDEKEVDRLIKYWGTEHILEQWKWINVPLKIEKERSEIDGSLAVMNDCGYL